MNYKGFYLHIGYPDRKSHSISLARERCPLKEIKGVLRPIISELNLKGEICTWVCDYHVFDYKKVMITRKCSRDMLQFGIALNQKLDHRSNTGVILSVSYDPESQEDSIGSIHKKLRSIARRKNHEWVSMVPVKPD